MEDWFENNTIDVTEAWWYVHRATWHQAMAYSAWHRAQNRRKWLETGMQLHPSREFFKASAEELEAVSWRFLFIEAERSES